jgi:glycine oxidase
MLAYAGSLLRHVVFGPRGYIVPRISRADTIPSGETLVGATSERVGFELGTTVQAATSLAAAGADILPPLAAMAPVRQWSGLRPMTPDLLPIIGPDPDQPSVLYACGHSRNGVLMAPLTAQCISAIVRGEPAPRDITPFAIARFAR